MRERVRKFKYALGSVVVKENEQFVLKNCIGLCYFQRKSTVFLKITWNINKWAEKLWDLITV